MLKLACVVMFFGITSGKLVININEEIDKLFDLNNAMEMSHGGAVTSLPDFTYYGTNYSSGFLVGLDSLTRTGDCTTTVLEDSIAEIEILSGYRLLALVFGGVSGPRARYSGVVTVKNDSFRLAVSTRNSPRCEVALRAAEVMEVSGVALSASAVLPYNDLTGFVNAFVVPDINRWLSKNKKYLEDGLREHVCSEKKPVGTFLHNLLHDLIKRN